MNSKPTHKTNLDIILTFLQREDLKKYPSAYFFSPLQLPFELVAEDFLKFGEDDLEKSDKHSVVNALGNIKRAIDCRVDSLLFLFGVYEVSREDNWDFPRKVKFLEKIGLLAPRVLKRINSKRNKLEHEYKLLSLDETEDSLDIARLFIESTNSFLKKTFEPFEWELDHNDGSQPWLRVELKSDKGCFKLELVDKKKTITAMLSNTNTEKFTWLLGEWIRAIKGFS